jgi:hypothetical protein
MGIIDPWTGVVPRLGVALLVSTPIRCPGPLRLDETFGHGDRWCRHGPAHSW